MSLYGDDRHFFSHRLTQIDHILSSFFPQTYFIPISHLYEGFEKKYPNMKYKMWQKIGLAITAQKIRENLSFEVRGVLLNSSYLPRSPSKPAQR